MKNLTLTTAGIGILAVFTMSSCSHRDQPDLGAFSFVTKRNVVIQMNDGPPAQPMMITDPSVLARDKSASAATRAAAAHAARSAYRAPAYVAPAVAAPVAAPLPTVPTQAHTASFSPVQTQKVKQSAVPAAAPVAPKPQAVAAPVAQPLPTVATKPASASLTPTQKQKPVVITQPSVAAPVAAPLPVVQNTYTPSPSPAQQQKATVIDYGRTTPSKNIYKVVPDELIVMPGVGRGRRR